MLPFTARFSLGANVYSMESPAPELSAICLPCDERDRPVSPGRPVLELLELWGEGAQGAGEGKGGCLPARDRVGQE